MEESIFYKETRPAKLALLSDQIFEGEATVLEMFDFKNRSTHSRTAAVFLELLMPIKTIRGNLTTFQNLRMGIAVPHLMF